ncbi:hypothetical protein BXZ70DRAFT_934778 [Cristinia sonorae]|uniref:SANT domain-containing protein n=1 Tax=Cristinia sonorae TaxID=1940300 RepID=A0A8K0XQD7_9AGAR|nr:hypothetical protein BXZ70DRAFT_934778 [Cristinia sonorae]
MSGRYEPRRSFNPPDFEPLYHTPEPLPYGAEPGLSPYYDRSLPPHAGPSNRGDISHTGSHRGDSWRPERTASHYRPPSPDRYSPARYPRQDTRRTSRYESPPRRTTSDSTHDGSWSRVPRDIMAERMFEPSESWKQNHHPGDYWEPGRESRPRRMSPPPHPNSRSWRRTPSPPARSQWDPLDNPRPSGTPYSQHGRSPSDRSYRPSSSYWDNTRRSSPDYPKPNFDNYGTHSASDHRRDSSGPAIPPRPPPPHSYDYDDRVVRHSPARPYGGAASPPTVLRRESYWPEAATTPNTRSPHESRFPRGGGSWGYHSRTPSDTYSPGIRRESFGASKESLASHQREGSISSSGPLPSERANPVSRSSSPPARRGHSHQQDRNSHRSAQSPFQDDRDSLASTPHNERQFSHASSPRASKTPSSIEASKDLQESVLTSAGKAENDDAALAGESAPGLTKTESTAPSLQAESNTPLPRDVCHLDDHPAPAEPMTVDDETTAEPETPAPATPLAPEIPGSNMTSAPGTPLISGSTAEQVGKRRRERDHVPVRAAPIPQSRKASRTVAVSAAASEAEDDSAAPEVAFPDTLRMFVMMRLRNSRQTREDRVLPVLSANEAVAAAHKAFAQLSKGSDGRPPAASPQELVEECMEAERVEARQATHVDVRPSLRARFAQRQAVLNDKVARLRAEYLELHERWLAHCASLDDVAKAGALEESSTSAGRTTRRSAATLGDAVRSDLEMEQIIASLGNEELTDANHLAARNAAIIPDMVTVDLNPKGGLEEYLQVYDDTNNAVDDPDAFYAPRTGKYDWTDDEKRTFLEKYAAYPKQFGIIAGFLPHKTPAQCVTYYYLHKHQIDFRKVVAKFAFGKRRRGGRGAAAAKNRRNALLSDILQRDAEFSREHTPAGTAAATPVPNGRRVKPVSSAAAGGEGRRSSGRRIISGLVEQTPGSTPTPDPEPEAKRKRRRVTAIRGIAAPDLEADDDAEEDGKPAKRGRKPRRVKESSAVTTSASTPVAAPEELANLPEDASQDASLRKKFTPTNTGWSEEEKAQLVTLLGRYGEDFKRIAASMSTKTTAQISVFYKANVADMNLDQVVASARQRSPTPEPTSSKTPNYRHIAYPGAGVMDSEIHPQPSTMGNGPPMIEMSSLPMPMHGSGSMESRFRMNSITVTRNRSALDGMGETMSMPAQGFFRPADIPMHAPPYGAPPLIPLPGHPPIMTGHPPHYITNPSPFASPPPQSSPPPPPAPPGMTTSFPSGFAYSNLSPSHFANGPPPPLPHPHVGVPPPNGMIPVPVPGATYGHPPPRAWGPP